MPEIRGFRAWRYNGERIGNLARALAPPYDVISPSEQQTLYKKSPYNVIRLILGKVTPKDTAVDNPYTRAGRLLKKWVSSGVLVQEPHPAVYVYAQNYHADRLQTRVGFVAAMRLDEKAVLRHENTLAAPKKDRLALLKEVKTNLSPLFGLFEDRKGEIQKILNEIIVGGASVVDVTLDGVRHRLYVESKPSLVSKIRRLIKTKPMLIADGHHRFEVACQFRDWMRAKCRGAPLWAPKRGRTTEDPGWNYVMTYFSDVCHNPFEIFPTHRLVRVVRAPLVGAQAGRAPAWPAGRQGTPLQLLKQKGFLKKAKSLNEVLSHLSETGPPLPYNFGVYAKKDGFFILTLDSRWASSKKLSIVDKLDVSVLHRAILEPCFGIRKIEKSKDIDFTRDATQACRRVKSGEFDAAFFLRPTSLSDMVLASKQGLKMPQKSTYFYPKLLSGLVFHKLDQKE